MTGWKLSDKAYELRKQYEDKYKEKARGWAWEEETMKEYEEYLEKSIKGIRIRYPFYCKTIADEP